VTTIADSDVVPPLAPIFAALNAIQARHGGAAIHGVAPDLLVSDPLGWLPATDLVSGEQLPDLLDTAKQRWGATPHAAAALAWKAYTYWLALPAVLGWASARRVPLVVPSRVLVRFTDHQPFLTIGLHRPTIAVLPSDPLLAMVGAAGGPRGTAASALDLQVVADEAQLLATLRASLLDAHLAPLLERIRLITHIGHRTMLGSLASGVAYGVVRASDALPGSTVETVTTLLDALDLADLVSLVPGSGGALTVQRHTCCLAFTLPEPKICSGCCIRQ
jgi:hypothetical protein